MEVIPIGFFHSPLKSKFGIPRQSGLVSELTGYVTFEPEYRQEEAVRGLEDFDFLWLIWGFSANRGEAHGLTVRPPRLGGNKRMGVFATRSPFRPNKLGLSCVQLDHVALHPKWGPVIYVRGADLMDGTPIYDVKPYVAYADAHPEARSGFVDQKDWEPLEVLVPEACARLFSEEELAALKATLAQDPRPQYQDDPERIYGMPYLDKDVRFRRVSALYKSDKLKSHFVKSLVYEIRNPLQSVMKLAEMVGRKDLYLSKEEKKHVADQISYHSSLMDTLLDEVEVYADSNKKGHEITDERFSPNRVCERCIDANLHNVPEGVKMSFRQETGQGVFVSADRHIVELVLNKLVVLACRFTKKGEITVGCRYEEDSHRLTFVVQDTGGGIPEGRGDALFNWYNDPDDVFDETEIDLSVSQKLASKVGGLLHWDETYKNGTRIEFILPVR